MTEKSKVYKWVIGFLVVYIILLLSFPFGNRPKEIMIEKVDTIQLFDTCYVKDTIVFEKTKLVPKYITVLKRDTVFDVNNTPIELITEKKTFQDTIICDKDTAELQIFTSGIKSNVDSTKVTLKKQETIITNTITIEKFIKPKKWNIGASLGYGLGLKNRDFEPFLGITLQYKF